MKNHKKKQAAASKQQKTQPHSRLSLYRLAIYERLCPLVHLGHTAQFGDETAADRKRAIADDRDLGVSEMKGSQA
jgi:hypothetical protein